jgi:translation initiation factor IF-3
MFRGREQAHPERGRALLKKLYEDLGGLAVIESDPLQEGRNMSMLLAPGKEAVKTVEGEAEPGVEAETPADAAPKAAPESPAPADAEPVADAEAPADAEPPADDAPAES